MGHAPDTFGIRLMKAQGRKSMSSTDLAMTVDANTSTIAHMRMDKHKPSVDMLLRICAALECSADFLLGLSDEPQVR